MKLALKLKMVIWITLYYCALEFDRITNIAVRIHLFYQVKNDFCVPINEMAPNWKFHNKTAVLILIVPKHITQKITVTPLQAIK